MYLSARIISKKAVSPTVTILDLLVPSLGTFRPGQWVDFRVPSMKWIGGFSISSCPSSLPRVQIAVKVSSHAPAMWVTHDSREGDCVEIQVGGDCVLHSVREPAVFCAGGIGISPLLSMYRQHAQERDTNHRRSAFYYSVSTEEELVYANDIIALSELHNDEVTMTLTKQLNWENPLERVRCLTGRKLASFLEENLSATTRYYLCGPPSMQDEAMDRLQKHDISTDRIVCERWW